MKKIQILLMLVALCFIGSAFAEPAQYRHWSVNAPALCHPAFLRYDSDVRKRPLAVVNEGSAPAYVTCSLPADLANPYGLAQAYIVLRNLSQAPMSINCTVVLGVDDGGAQYITRTVQVGAGQRVTLAVEPEDFNREYLRQRIGFSCNLPVMAGINEIGTEEKI
jgi:hypothetical protein